LRSAVQLKLAAVEGLSILQLTSTAIEATIQTLTLEPATADNMTPVGMGRALAEAIPRANLRLVPNEGHLIFLSHWREIAEDLITETETSQSKN
jgi:hypothetical protein